MVTRPAAPPHAAKERRRPIDFVGLALIALGLGALELVLDKGQEEDWFHVRLHHRLRDRRRRRARSPSSSGSGATSNPIVDVRLFKNRSFAIANVMMLVLGIALYGTTVLLPQFSQIMLGYTAELAGMALSPGGLIVMLLMPLVGY